MAGNYAMHPLGMVHAIAVRSQGSRKFEMKKVDDHLVLPQEASDSNLTQMPLFCLAPASSPPTTLTEWLQYIRRHLPVAEPIPVDLPTFLLTPSCWPLEVFYDWLHQASQYLPASPAIVHVPLGKHAGYLDVAKMQVQLPDGRVIDIVQAGCQQMAATARFVLLQSLNKVYQSEGHVYEHEDTDEEEPICLPQAGKVLPADVTYDDIKRLVRKGAQLGMLTAVLCYNEEEDLYRIACDYAPSLLDQELEANARYFLEIGETLPDWQALRRSLSRARCCPVVGSSPAATEDVPPPSPLPPFHHQRYVGILDRRSQMQDSNVFELLGVETPSTACLVDTSAMQQPPVNVDCKAHTLCVSDVMPLYKQNAFYMNTVPVDSLVALFTMSGYPQDSPDGGGRVTPEQKLHPLAEAVKNTIEHCNDRRLPMMFALDVSSDGCNPQGFLRLAQHCSMQWGFEQRRERRGTDDVRQLLRSLHVLQMQAPIMAGSQLKGLLNLVEMNMDLFTDQGVQTCEIPPDMQDEAQKLHNELITTLTICSTKLRTATRKGEKLSSQELKHAIRIATLRQLLAPLILFHGGKGRAGKQLLLRPIVEYLPSPWDLHAVQEYYPSVYERVEGRLKPQQEQRVSSDHSSSSSIRQPDSCSSHAISYGGSSDSSSSP